MMMIIEAKCAIITANVEVLQKSRRRAPKWAWRACGRLVGFRGRVGAVLLPILNTGDEGLRI